LIAYVAVQCVLSSIAIVHDRRLEREAKQWFAQAQEDAKPTWTEDDAVRWLTEHGIRPYRGEQSGTGGHYLTVDGYQPIEAGGTLIRPASVNITFLFDLDHRFERVEYELCRFAGPWLRVTGK
jgi:hypothetical protein